MKRIFLIGFLCSSLAAGAQEALTFLRPFDFPLLLSANFGELRPNHFHGGLDIKTGGVTGKPVHVVADGYVSRITVSPTGYGNALYVTHPNGYTSVYGHLETFHEKIARYVEEYQYANETFSVDIRPDSTMFRFNAGDVIARSGNSGSSGGPHLHLELRKSDTNEMIDPLPFYKDALKDTRRPLSQGLMAFSFPGEGVINARSDKQVFAWIAGGSAVSRHIDAWGKIAFAIRANDYMTRTSNIYGVRSITLKVDSIEIFRSRISKVAFDENRAINGWADYETYSRNRQWYVKSFLLPGNKLSFLQSDSSQKGWVTIDEERDYHFCYELEDGFGNKSVYRFVVHGKPQEIPRPVRKGNMMLRWNRANTITRPGMQFVIPKGMLYEDTDVNVDMTSDSTGIAYTYQLNDRIIPLHTYCPLRIGVRHMPVADSTKYYIAQKFGSRNVYMRSKWVDGWLEASVRELGTYTVDMDTVAPVITPLSKSRWQRSGTITFRIADKNSGVESFKGKIDGKFVLFENHKPGRLVCYLRKAKVERGKLHTLELTVTDKCGNVEVYTEKMRY